MTKKNSRFSSHLVFHFFSHSLISLRWFISFLRFCIGWHQTIVQQSSQTGAITVQHTAADGGRTRVTVAAPQQFPVATNEPMMYQPAGLPAVQINPNPNMIQVAQPMVHPATLVWNVVFLGRNWIIEYKFVVIPETEANLRCATPSLTNKTAGGTHGGWQSLLRTAGFASGRP